ncbi:hypothetical protein RJP21_21550 [Paenibacillus sp. VCA1]|uniref:hypothetical protein n=1 Tax=Paenibacillus sp. VCA1 TaxID=3039148 RepID=UPI002872A016|nr:hypothetical protein [Paenibacillus sp. VCA1]MDR9856192.1 hypothetical protein [Paenibacillus sp. VCA1]
MKQIIHFLLLISFLCSCSGGNRTKIDQNHNTIFSYNNNSLKSVEISMYRTNSIRVQPELINVYFEQSEIEKIKSWIMNTTNATTSISSSINSIFLYKFIYQGLNNIEEEKMLVYVIDQNNDVFIHQISADTLRKINSFDTFQEKDRSTILSYIGEDDWYKTNDLIMN